MVDFIKTIPIGQAMGPDLWGKCLWCKNNLLRLLADIGEDTAVDIEHVAVDCIGGM